MIKRTLYFGNPSYLSLTNAQLVLRLPVESTFQKFYTFGKVLHLLKKQLKFEKES